MGANNISESSRLHQDVCKIYPRPSTWDPRPLILDKKIDSLLVVQPGNFSGPESHFLFHLYTKQTKTLLYAWNFLYEEIIIITKRYS